MVFWRSKANNKQGTADVPAKPQHAAESAEADAADEAVQPAADDATAPAKQVAHTSDESSAQSSSQSNVVTLATSRPSERLSERLADVADPPAAIGKRRADDDVLVLPSDPLLLPGQSTALSEMREALKDGRSGAHLLLLGEEGSGRRWAADKLAHLCAADKKPPKDWVYVVDPDDPSRLSAFQVPSGVGAALARDVNAALEKSAAMRSRLLEGDDHRLARELLEEETRRAGDGALEQLRRRAEAQNIAVVKSIDGYVLAPMHEGRMVRPEVFRSLPQSLQRDVEAKINALEGELHSLVAAGPDAELAAGEKHAALSRHVAMTAAKPNLALARKLHGKVEAAEKICALVERAFTRAAEAGDHVDLAHGPTVISTAAPYGADAGAPVVKAFATSRAELFGEIGRDAAGRLALRQGQLLRANGGYLIVEAWRLVADPAAWLALSQVIEQGCCAPLAAPGIAVTPEPIPFSGTLIVIADPASWNKLKSIDPGAERHFRHIAHFVGSAATSEVSEASYVAAAGALASEHGLRALYASGGSLLYADAVERGEGRVSLDRSKLLKLLEDADGLAASAAAENIRASDVRRAIEHQQRAAGRTR